MPHSLKLFSISLTLTLSATAHASSAWWTIGSTVNTKEWDSGKTKSLSSWKTLNCTTAYGSQYALTKLGLYREPAANTDNFVARLRGTCSLFTYANGNSYTTTLRSKDIFSANHRTPEYRTPTVSRLGSTGNYGSGVRMTLDPASTYAKNFSLKYKGARKNDISGKIDYFALDGSEAINQDGYTLATISYIPLWGMAKMVHLTCAGRAVMTGLELRYDTRKGKIRRLKIHCRPLRYTPLY